MAGSNKADRFGSTVTIDASGFNTAMVQLSKMTGVSFKKVIKAELGKILEKTVRKTKAAKVKDITARYTYKAGIKPDKKLKGRVIIDGRRRNILSIKPMHREHVKYGVRVGQKVINPDWKKLQDILKKKMKYAKGMRGLAKATWYKQAKDMKINITVPKYVKKAYKGIGRAAVRTLAKELHRKPYVILVKNSATIPLLKDVGGYGAFLGALNGRQKFFEKNLSKGVFDSAKEKTEKYGFLTSQ